MRSVLSAFALSVLGGFLPVASAGQQEPVRQTWAPEADRPTEAVRLSVEEAVRLGLRHNATYRSALIEVERARGTKLGTMPLFPANPALGFDVGPRSQPNGRDELSYALRVEQSFDLFGQRAARIAAADAKILAVAARAATVEVEVRARVRAVYTGVLIARQRTGFAAERLRNAARTLESAIARVKAGAASEIEQRLAEAELAQARVATLESEDMVARQLADLRLVLDIPAGTAVVLTTPLAPPAVRTILPERLLALARERRRDLIALRREGAALGAEIERLRAERLPPVALAFTMQRDAPAQTWIAGGVALSLPVWRRNQGAIAETGADSVRNRIAVEFTERSVERDLEEALRIAKWRRQEVELLETSALRAVTRAFELVFDGWRAGKFDLFRLLVAQRDVVNAQFEYLDALAALWTAEIEIDRSTGEETK